VTADALLESLNLLNGQDRIEVKRGAEADKSLFETVRDFANVPNLSSRRIALDIVRDELALLPTYKVEGITNLEKISTDVTVQCNSMFNNPLRDDITAKSVQDKNVVIVFFPKVQPQDKPIVFKAEELAHGALRRIGSTDSRCVRNTYLGRLRSGGRLVVTNPARPNDPHQAFRAKEVNNE
jgi:ATP-dependent DNA helicase RecG